MNNSNDLEIIIDNMKIPYSIRESKKAKYLRIIIDSEGLRVVKPNRAKFDEVKPLLESKSKWIYEHYSMIMNNKKPQPKWDRTNTKNLLYLGEKYNLDIISHPKNNITVKFTDEIFCVNVPEKISDSELEPLMKEAIKKWYIKNARQTLKERLDYFCKIIGVSYKEFKIKEQKTRWGSCSAKGNLNFNWKIIMANPYILDYVVVHELCHLKYMNHSKNYWALVERYFPNYKNAQDWLKKNALSLQL